MTKSLIIASIMIPALLTSCGEGSKGTTAPPGADHCYR